MCLAQLAHIRISTAPCLDEIIVLPAHPPPRAKVPPSASAGARLEIFQSASVSGPGRDKEKHGPPHRPPHFNTTQK